MVKRILTEKARKSNELLYHMLLGLSALIVLFAVILQHDKSLFTGFWNIQMGHAGLITDPICTGGPGAALLNAALVLFLSTFLVRIQRMPFTGLSVACLFMMAGFSLLGKNVINSLPILLGGYLYSRYKDEPFAKYTYLTLFGTCLSPLVSYFMLHLNTDLKYVFMILAGTIIGFVLPAISGHTVRLHQGYNLYNVGTSAGFVGLASVSILRGFGLEFDLNPTWSTEYNLPLCILVLCILASLFATGIILDCKSWKGYKRIMRHSGRAVADFFALEGLGPTFVNMALVGLIGLVYLQVLKIPLNGPLLCCLFAMTGFGCFGKHPRNVIPVMAGAIIASLLMDHVPLTSPGVLLATLLCTGLAPIAGQFGPLWGMAAGFLHMAIVQNTSYLHGGLNLYNNGFAAGLTCVIMIPLIESLKAEPED